MFKDKIVISNYKSPCGILVVGSLNEKLCMCDWLTEPHHSKIINRLKRALNTSVTEGRSNVIDNAIKELDEYFAGERSEFDIPLLFAGSEFQQSVWNALLNIPYGKTVSYGDMAMEMGCPKSVRALANANGSNAISIFVPCHRVIGSNGSLTGYGGGLDAKQYLLSLEASQRCSSAIQ